MTDLNRVEALLRARMAAELKKIQFDDLFSSSTKVITHKRQLFSKSESTIAARFPKIALRM